MSTLNEDAILKLRERCDEALDSIGDALFGILWDDRSILDCREARDMLKRAHDTAEALNSHIANSYVISRNGGVEIKEGKCLD